MEKSSDKAFAALALKKKYLDYQELREAIRLQILMRSARHVELTLGDVLLARSVLTLEQVNELEDEVTSCFAQHRLMRTQEMQGFTNLGEQLVELGYATPSEILTALEAEKQKRLDGSVPRLLGEVLKEMGVIDEKQLEEGLASLYEKQLREIKGGRQGPG